MIEAASDTGVYGFFLGAAPGIPVGLGIVSGIEYFMAMPHVGN